MATLAEQIAAFSTRTLNKMESVVHDTVVGIGMEAVDKTPLGKKDLWSGKWQKERPEYKPGNLKSSWKYSFNGEGAVTLAELSSAKGFGKHVIFNDATGPNLLRNEGPVTINYATVVERGRGNVHPNWELTLPNQALGFADGGAHMVELTIMAAPSIVNAAIEKAKAM